MSATLPHTSVVMSCYNEAKYIEKSIKSLIDDYCLKNCEIIAKNSTTTFLFPLYGLLFFFSQLSIN